MSRPGGRGAARFGAGALAGAVLAVAAGGCGSSPSPATRQAQAYAAGRNLRLADLPEGWTPHGAAVDGSSATASTLAPSQEPTLRSLLAGLPASCRPFEGTFTESLLGAPPKGTLAENQVEFTSAADGGAVISSTVAVFGTVASATAHGAIWTAPQFSPCLQAFLTATSRDLSGMSGVQVSVSSAETAVPPAGVEATTFSVAQSGARPGGQTEVSVAQEAVLRAGRAMAFVEVESATTSLPVDAVNVFYRSVTAVEHRLVPPLD